MTRILRHCKTGMYWTGTDWADYPEAHVFPTMVEAVQTYYSKGLHDVELVFQLGTQPNPVQDPKVSLDTVRTL